MFLHNPKMMYTVRVDQPNPEFAKMLLEQFGGPNGELAAAIRYFLQGWNETDGGRRSMLLDIATEELSHLEMVAQTLSLLLKGSPSELVDQVEGNYLGELLDGKMPGYMAMAVNSGPNVLGGGRGGGETGGFELAQANSQWGFELNDKPVASASTQKVQ